jgi:hypothetical protein
MLLQIHEMFILSALDHGSIGYGSIQWSQYTRLRIALGIFCVCKTTNILYESGYENLTERRRRKLTNTALLVAEKENHPVNKLLIDQEVYMMNIPSDAN